MGAFSNIVLPVSVSLAIHGLLFVMLAVGWQDTPKPNRIVPPQYIEAKLVKLEDQSKKKASVQKQPKKIDLTAQRREQERLKREAERKRQARIQREKDAAAKAAAEQKRKEDEDKLRREREEQARQEQERRLRQQAFQDALKEEQGLLQEEVYATEAQSFISRIRQRVESNWSRPPAARSGMRCVLQIQLVPTGRIVAVNVVESSGNTAFDRSAVQAVKKVEVFPEVKEMSPEVFERFYRNFNFLFNPQDLRL